MKRTLAWILTLVMLLGMLPMGVFADETATDTTFKLYFETDVTDVSALEIGDKITVTAYLANNPGFAGLKTKLTWDNSVVQFDGFTTETFRNQEYLVSEVIADATYNQDKGTVVVGETDDLTASGKLWEAVFTVLKDGDTRIALSTDGDDFQMINAATTKRSPTIDQTALDALIVPTHIHDYTYGTEVVDPTCTEGGYTLHTCACGDSYTDTATSATGHTYVDGTCSVCGAAGTIIPEGAPFIDMLTTDGQPVTVTHVGTEPVYGMGPLYKVEVPLGTTQVNVTYPEDAVALTNFGYSANIMIGFANVTDDGYGATKKDGKVTVGLAMEKAAANGSTTIIKLINVPYGDEPRSVGFYDPNGLPTHFLAFTYKLGNGQHFAALPEGIGYTVTGSPIASDGYTFQVSIEDGYEATSDFAVKVNGNTVATEAGSISVPSVTEDLDITVEGVAKIVDLENDIFVTVDLTDYTGPVEGSLYYMTKTGESSEVTLTAGKKNSLALKASDNNGDGFWASIYSVSTLVIGYDVNGTVYPIPNEYSSYSPGSGFSMNMDQDGDLQLINRSTTPCTFVVKPIVGTSESLGAAPDFAEPGIIDVTDIAVIGADVISSEWEGDTLNVILAEDTAADAALKTLWTIYANNTKEGASQPCFNINGRLQTPSGTEATFTWDEGMTLEDGTATKTYVFEVAEMPWNPESALEFTPKTFTINFYVSGKEPAPTYTVSVDGEITNGTVTADPTSAEEGAEITLTVTPDTGYVLKSLTVTDATGAEVTVTDNKFTMPASNVTVSAVFEEEVNEPEYKSAYGITVMVGDEEMDLVANGTETCGILQAQKLNVTVPTGTTEVKFLNITDTVMYGQMYVYSGAHDWTEYASNVTEATISLTECGTSFCVSDSANAWYHVNITVEEPTPSYKSSYGITVMVGDEEMDLVANGTETCGILQAQKLNITVPAGTTEVKFLNITDTVMYGQMYVYSGSHNWTEYASNVTEATISLTECGTSFCVSDSANAWYHVNITVEEPTPSYKSEYGITVLVGNEEMDLVANGTETCGILQAQKLNVTVPAGTTEVKFLNITDTVMYGQMYVYSGSHNWTEYASNVTEATISLAECGTSFCVSDSANAWYHVNITVEEPAPSYKSEYGITVMVGDEEMDLVANGTETCGILQAQKLNVTVPAGTTEVKFLNITDTVMYGQMYVYSGSHNWTEYASNVTEATISLAECGTSFCVSDSANAWYHVNIIVEEPEIESNPITKIEISHPSIETNAETGAMTMAMVTGTNEQIDMSFAVENAELAATQIVVWFSTEETVATVDQTGKVTAKAAGTTVITAKAVDASGIALLADGEEVLAQFTLTVTDPTEGYTLTMGEDVENALIGSTVSIPVTIGHTGDVTVYNAFDLTFAYDPAILELTSTEIEGMTVTAEGGKIHVERYGKDLAVDSTALTLTFKAIATGDTNVKVTSAKVDVSESALMNDAPDASVIDNITLVSVGGYTVSLPTEFIGETSVLPGADYTFEAKDKNYNYTFDGSTMGDDPVTVKDNGNGTFTIENVSGNIVIQTVPTGKIFSVTLDEDLTGDATAQYMTDYVATLTKDANYNYNVSVNIGGVKYTGFTYDDATGKITIPGEAITGEIVFNSGKTEKTQDKHSITFTGAYGDIAEDTALEVVNGNDYILTINKVLGYKYTVTATMGGNAVDVIDNGDGTYTIKNVTGDLVINIVKEYDLEVEVKEYVTLNGKTMFLVTATATVDDNKVLSYDGTAMFYSNQYNAWSYLVITDTTLSVDDAKAKITLNVGTKVELNQTFNANETLNDTVDINDAQLVFDMYNNEYQDFTKDATMQKFLKADVNGDKTIDVNDAAAIVSEIVKNK